MVINELKSIIEKHTNKPVFDKRLNADSFNNNSYIIHVDHLDALKSCIYGYVIFCGDAFTMATELKEIQGFTLLDNIKIEKNYFDDNTICSQNFRYDFSKSNITNSKYKTSNIT